MNNAQEKSGEFAAPGKSKEQDLDFIHAEQKFESKIKPEIDIYFPKLIAFTEAILRTIESSDKTAVFIGRDGRWLYYMAKLLGGHKKVLKDKIKFIDISRDYIHVYEGGDYLHPSKTTPKRATEYEDYFRKLSININQSFLIDVGFQGDIIHDVREATNTKNDDDMLLVKSDLQIHPEIKGFYRGVASPEWDENIKMGHLIEDDFPQIVLPVDKLSPVHGGRLPEYEHVQNNSGRFLASMIYQYLKKSIENFTKNQKTKDADAQS